MESRLPKHTPGRHRYKATVTEQGWGLSGRASLVKGRGWSLCGRGLWWGGKNVGGVQAESTGCSYEEVRMRSGAGEIPLQRGRHPGHPLFGLHIGVRAATVLPISSSWGCLHLGLFPPLWSCGQDGRMVHTPTALVCPCSFWWAVRAEGLKNRGDVFLPNLELFAACP